VLLLPRGNSRVSAARSTRASIAAPWRAALPPKARPSARWSTACAPDRDALYFDDCSRLMGEIGALLGFSSPNAFSRWHRRQFGQAADTR
jgi:AraC-like DNA-binding protein